MKLVCIIISWSELFSIAFAEMEMSDHYFISLHKWDKVGEVIEKFVNSDGSVTSYNVRAGGRTYFRSTRHLMRQKEQAPGAA